MSDADAEDSPSSPTSLSSTSTSTSMLSTPPPDTPPTLFQNSEDPAVPWLVQKYGGTSVGKFAVKIAEDIVPNYLSQHKLAIVCSARSGSTKALGTTNLLLRAADEALQRSNPSPTSGIATPQTPSAFTSASQYSFLSRKNSLNETGTSQSRPSTPSPGPGLAQARGRRGSSTRSGTCSPSPFTPLASPARYSAPASPALGPAPASALPPFNATVDLLRLEHIAAARAAIRDPALLLDLEGEIDRDCERLRSFLFAAQIIDEISPRSRDNIVGVGERLACKIVAAILCDRDIDAEYVSLENIVPELEDDGELRTGNGTLDQVFYDRLAAAIGARIQQCGTRVPVITGFFGPVPGSLLRQVGRGYTDLLAALLAVGLRAAELQIWKEVDGIFTADPRKVPTARLIPLISPDEAAELTYYGSEVVHPFTMEQVIRRKIPIRIKNVENPGGGGTVIHPDPDIDGAQALHASAPSAPGAPQATPLATLQRLALAADDMESAMARRTRKLPTAVTIKERIVVLNVHSNRKSVSHGFFAGIFSALDRFGVVVDLISTSEVHVSMAIEDGLGKRMLERVVRELQKSGTVSVHPNMAILSLVGKQMRNLVGIAGRMFATLAEGNVNIEMISQGASEINISCVIDGRDAVKALNLIHQSCLQIKPEGSIGRSPWLF